MSLAQLDLLAASELQVNKNSQAAEFGTTWPIKAQTF